MSKLVMIVDDSPTVRKIVEVVLSREGYEVVAVPDGVEALRSLLAPQARLPDLILLDIEMPRMDGYTLALRCRRRERPRLSHIPIVMLSRRAGVIDKLKARLAGVRGSLTKPFKEQDLRALVADCIGPAREVVRLRGRKGCDALKQASLLIYQPLQPAPNCYQCTIRSRNSRMRGSFGHIPCMTS